MSWIMFYSASVAIRATWNYKVTPKRMHTTARLYQDCRACPNYGLSDHASMFDDGSDCVKGERPWTISER